MSHAIQSTAAAVQMIDECLGIALLMGMEHQLKCALCVIKIL